MPASVTGATGLVLHVIGAAVLFGTGLGNAFFMLLAHPTGDPTVIAAVARIVGIADLSIDRARPVYGRILAPRRVDAAAQARPCP